MKKIGKTILIENRKARFDYEEFDTFEAGIILAGSEVKSIRSGHWNLTGSYVTIHSWRPIIMGLHISEYAFNSGLKLDPKRDRFLLMKKKEIIRIQTKLKIGGYTLIPMEIYSLWNLIKLRIILARWRKKHEKKQVLKERDLDRQAHREISRYTY